MKVEYNNDDTQDKFRGFRCNRQYISKLVSVDGLLFWEGLGRLYALAFFLRWIGLLLFARLLFLDYFSNLFSLDYFLLLLFFNLFSRWLFFGLLLSHINLILVFFEDDRIEVDFADKWKLLLRLQSIEKHAILVLLSSQYQISDFELLFIHKLKHLLGFSLLLRHNQDRFSSLLQQPLEQAHNKLRVEADAQQVRADDGIILLGGLVEFFKVDLEGINIPDLIIMAVLHHILDHLIPEITQGHLFGICPLPQCDSCNPHPGLEHEHFLILELVALEDDVPGNYHVDVPQSESLQLVGEDIDVRNGHPHLVAVVEDDVSAAQSEHDPLAGLGGVRPAAVGLVSHPVSGLL